MKKLLLLLLHFFDNQVILAQPFESNWESLNKRKMPDWFQ